jgi:protease I
LDTTNILHILHKNKNKNMKKALIITWEKFQDHELIYPYYSLKEAGYDVTLMANKIGKIWGSLGTHMPCDIETTAFEDETTRQQYLNEYEILLIPGGVKALEKLRQEKGVLKFVQEWNSLDKTIFSVCNGAQLLISAKILQGRTLSGYYSIDIDIENAGATYSRGPVVVDGNIISCPHYDFMGDWMRTAYQVHNERSKSNE